MLRARARVVGPVELEPAGSAAAGLGDLLHRKVSGGAGDHRHPDRGGGAGGGELATVVDHLLDPDWRQQQRRRHRRAEDGGGEVAIGDVAQHPRHDPAAAEGLGVGVDRVLAAGPGPDVVGGFGVHRRHRSLLELGDRDRNRRRLAAEAAGVDLAVVVGGIRHWAKDRLTCPMIDSHTHLFLCDGSEEELVAAALGAGVSRMLTIGMGSESNPVAVASAERHEAVFAAVGRHPNDATGFDEAAAEEIRRLGAHEKVRAIGETGLDFYRDTAAPEDQRRAFVGADRDRAGSGLADRDPRPRPRGRDRRHRRDLRHARRRGRRGAGDPPLLLGPVPGRGRGRAWLVLLIRRQRHLSRAPRSCCSRPRRCRRT